MTRDERVSEVRVVSDDVDQGAAALVDAGVTREGNDGLVSNAVLVGAEDDAGLAC